MFIHRALGLTWPRTHLGCFRMLYSGKKSPHQRHRPAHVSGHPHFPCPPLPYTIEMAAWISGLFWQEKAAGILGDEKLRKCRCLHPPPFPPHLFSFFPSSLHQPFKLSVSVHMSLVPGWWPAGVACSGVAAWHRPFTYHTSHSVGSNSPSAYATDQASTSASWARAQPGASQRCTC